MGVVTNEDEEVMKDKVRRKGRKEGVIECLSP